METMIDDTNNSINMSLQGHTSSQSKDEDSEHNSSYTDIEFLSDTENKVNYKPIKIKTSLFSKVNLTNRRTSLSSNSINSPPSTPEVDRYESDTENDTLKQRQKNIKARNDFFASFLQDPEFAEAVENIGVFAKEKEPTQSSKISTKKTKFRKSNRDQSFRTAYRVLSDYEPRKSNRLSNKKVLYTHDDLIDVERLSYKKKRSYDSDNEIDSLEDIIYKPRAKRASNGRVTERVSFLYVEDVTESMIANIATKVSEKVYSEKGTSCHQCRQKTLDTKTFCRSESCVGVRGQFCGVCLLNRYGEVAATVLKDPNWHCPVCRGICNCSFCRAKMGKRPTGILTPLALQTGHKSVKDFLESLKGKGDYVDLTKDPGAVLGFSANLQYVHLNNNDKIDLVCDSVTQINEITRLVDLVDVKLLRMQLIVAETKKDERLLLGFSNNGRYAHMGTGEIEDILN